MEISYNDKRKAKKAANLFIKAYNDPKMGRVPDRGLLYFGGKYDACWLDLDHPDHVFEEFCRIYMSSRELRLAHARYDRYMNTDKILEMVEKLKNPAQTSLF